MLLSVESLRKNKEKKGNSWKTQDFKRQQRCTMNPQQKIFLISNTQTPLIQTLAIQGSTLHLVSHDQEIYISSPDLGQLPLLVLIHQHRDSFPLTILSFLFDNFSTLQGKHIPTQRLLPVVVFFLRRASIPSCLTEDY